MFVQCIGGKGTRQPEGSITAPGAPPALKILATPVPSKQPPGMRESLVHHTYNICVPRSTSWKAVLNFHTNVMNDPIDVSGSFCLPSLSCHRGNCLIAKIIILFMTYLDQWWKQKCFWSPPPKKNRQDRFTLAWEDLSYTVTDIGLGFVDAQALDWCLRKFPWSCPCGWKTSTES